MGHQAAISWRPGTPCTWISLFRAPGDSDRLLDPLSTSLSWPPAGAGQGFWLGVALRLWAKLLRLTGYPRTSCTSRANDPRA